MGRLSHYTANVNRAEAYAKLGEYDKALTDLNTIRSLPLAPSLQDHSG